MKSGKYLFIIPMMFVMGFSLVTAQTVLPTDINVSVQVGTVTPILTTSTTPGMSGTITPSPSPEVKDVQITEIKGKVVKVNEKTISLEQNDKSIKDITIPDGAKVTRDNKDAAVQDIKIDDTAVVTVGSDQQVIKVNITSNTISQLSAFAIPALIIGILLVGLILYLINKSKQGHIVTAK